MAGKNKIAVKVNYPYYKQDHIRKSAYNTLIRANSLAVASERSIQVTKDLITDSLSRIGSRTDVLHCDDS